MMKVENEDMLNMIKIMVGCLELPDYNKGISMGQVKDKIRVIRRYLQELSNKLY